MITASVITCFVGALYGMRMELSRGFKGALGGFSDYRLISGSECFSTSFNISLSVIFFFSGQIKKQYLRPVHDMDINKFIAQNIKPWLNRYILYGVFQTTETGKDSDQDSWCSPRRILLFSFMVKYYTGWERGC